MGKVLCKILNNRLVECLDRERALHETLGNYMDIMLHLHGRLKEDKPTYVDVQKAYETHSHCVARWLVVETAGYGC